MAKKLYVGNMAYTTTDASLKDAFSQVGNISSASIIIDRMTGRSKGFGFVEFADDSEADAAIEKFNGFELDGRKLTVNEARPMEPRAPRSNTGGYNDRGGMGGGNDRSGGRNW